MNRIVSSIARGLTLVSCLFAFNGCSSSSDGGFEDPELGIPYGEGVSVNLDNLVGTWVCVKIEWDEDGEKDVETFSDGRKYMVLAEDGTGYINPYNLFEDEKHGAFTWTVSDNALHFSDHSDYTVKVLTTSALVLEWIDADEYGYLKETHTFKKLGAEE